MQHYAASFVALFFIREKEMSRMKFEPVRDLLTGQELLEAIKRAAEKRHGIYEAIDLMTEEIVSGGCVLTMVDFGKERGLGAIKYRLSEIYGEKHFEGTLSIDRFTGEIISFEEEE